MTFAPFAGERKKSESSRSGEVAIPIQRRFDPASAAAIAPSIGNQQMQALLEPQRQSDVVVSQPGDASELEAERIAGDIVRGSASPSCSQGELCQCDGCLQRRASENGTVFADVTPSINSQGRPLDDTTREFFEPRFGRDFSDVRVHTGDEASRTTRDLGAYAFTVGHDIVFGDSQYAPHAEQGKQLLAHELVHTVQQKESSGVRIQRAMPSVVPPWVPRVPPPGLLPLPWTLPGVIPRALPGAAAAAKTDLYSMGEFLTYVIAGLDIGAIAIYAKSVAEREAPAYAAAGKDYGPQNALRHCILAGLLDTWCWRAAIAEIVGGAALAGWVNPGFAELAAYGAVMGTRLRLFLMGHEWFGDDGCGNYGTGTTDSQCDRHNNEEGLSIGGPFTSDATVISESKAALDGGRLWMTPGPTTLTYTVSTSLWRTKPWMIPTPQQVDCSKVVLK
jgi:hypothetical protein